MKLLLMLQPLQLLLFTWRDGEWRRMRKTTTLHSQCDCCKLELWIWRATMYRWFGGKQAVHGQIYAICTAMFYDLSICFMSTFEFSGYYLVDKSKLKTHSRKSKRTPQKYRATPYLSENFILPAWKCEKLNEINSQKTVFRKKKFWFIFFCFNEKETIRFSGS